MTSICRGDGDPYVPSGSIGLTVYFPPVLQFVTPTDPLIEQKLRLFVEQGHRKRLRFDRLCEELHRYARAIGYDAVLSAHEVQSTDVFSYGADAVKSGLILMEVTRIQPPEGYHVRRLRESAELRPL